MPNDNRYTTGPFINCTCCGSQFTDDHEQDARYFVCWQCDEERMAEERRLDEMEAECGWFSAADER